MHQALPAALATTTSLRGSAGTAADAAYAAQHSREFGATLRTRLPASLHRMEASLRDAAWAASDIGRRHREQQQSGASMLSGLVPTRLRGLWPAGGGSPARGGSSGERGTGASGHGMYEG